MFRSIERVWRNLSTARMSEIAETGLRRAGMGLLTVN